MRITAKIKTSIMPPILSAAFPSLTTSSLTHSFTLVARVVLSRYCPRTPPRSQCMHCLNTEKSRLAAWALGVILLSYDVAAHAEPAAYIEFVSGTAYIADGVNQRRTPEKGMSVDSGETVSTADGRVQVRFTDGGYFSLQPNTQFRIDEYRYAHGDDDRWLLSLLKGGLRTISGLVGKQNRSAYR